MINDMNHLFFLKQESKQALGEAPPALLLFAVRIMRKTIPPSQGWTKIRLHLQDVNETYTAAFQKQVTQIAFGKLCVKANLLALCLIPKM